MGGSYRQHSVCHDPAGGGCCEPVVEAWAAALAPNIVECWTAEIDALLCERRCVGIM